MPVSCYPPSFTASASNLLMAEISNSPRLWAAVIGFAAWAAVACSQEPTALVRSSSWSVSSVFAVQPPASDERPVVWIGLKNISTQVRLICEVSTGYAVQHPDYNNGHAEGGSHACLGASAFAPVLPGESRFVTIPVKRDDLRLDAAELSIEMLVAETQMAANSSRQTFALSWTGNVRKILDAGRAAK